MTKAQEMLAFAREQLGEIYDLGDHGPNTWDCSGLTMEMVKLMGLRWKHSSNAQWYNNIKPGGDFSDYGTIDTLPPDRFAFIFHYGKRSNGLMGMVHVGAYDGVTHHTIQAGGYGKKVVVNGVRKSTVSEDPLDKRRWTMWAHVKGQDNEGGTEMQPTISRGSKGQSVEALQQALNAAGAKLKVDGDFGTATEAALKAYQTSHGLEADGVCGPVTWAVIQPSDPTATEPTIAERVAALETRVTALESK